MEGLKEKKEKKRKEKIEKKRKKKRKEKGFIWTISINVSANSHVKSFYDHQKKRSLYFLLVTNGNI
jgi:hypothetical protein